MTEIQTSTKDCWRTPPEILEVVNRFYPCGWFDPCPDEPDFNGLEIKWPANVFVNPPFSEYLKWVNHGKLQPLEQIWLCDHDHSTQRFQDLVPGASICMLFQRVAFIHPETGSPIKANPRCQTLIYRGNYHDYFRKLFGNIGIIAVFN